MEIIGLASDHAGYDLKCIIKDHLEKLGYVTKDYGCDSSVSSDYPDFAHCAGILKLQDLQDIITMQIFVLCLPDLLMRVRQKR